MLIILFVIISYFNNMAFCALVFLFFFSSRRRHTRCSRDWSSDVCSSDLLGPEDREDFVLPKEPSAETVTSRLASHPADGALINSSSTFGTLLSSQGSCAHRRFAFRLGFGATRTNLPVPQGAVKSVPWSRLPLTRPRRDARKRLKSEDSQRGSRWAGRPTAEATGGLASRRLRRG